MLVIVYMKVLKFERYLSNMGDPIVLACNVACDYVGIRVFVKLVEEADLDPIFLCESLHLCPVHDCKAPVCVSFNSTHCVPPKAKLETLINVVSTLQVYNETGVGEIMLLLTKPQQAGTAMAGAIVPDGFKPGTYQVDFQIDTTSDPEPIPPIVFPAGTYQVEFLACQGSCGSKHAHTRLLAHVNTTFELFEE
jgi:hypothetical protein